MPSPPWDNPSTGQGRRPAGLEAPIFPRTRRDPIRSSVNLAIAPLSRLCLAFASLPTATGTGQPAGRAAHKSLAFSLLCRTQSLFSRSLGLAWLLPSVLSLGIRILRVSELTPKTPSSHSSRHRPCVQAQVCIPGPQDTNKTSAEEMGWV